MRGWIGVDLDGTLAEYHGWQGINHIGPPIEPMVARVKQWLAEGQEVRIFTARVSSDDSSELIVIRAAIHKWCREHIGRTLEVTNVKDYGMKELYDDRCVTVEQNTGRLIGREQERFTP